MQTIKLFKFLFSFVLSLILFSCSKEESIPDLNIQNANQVRTSTGAQMQFIVSLKEISTGNTSVDYTLVDGTAKASKDFVAASGTVTIAANEKQAIIGVQIIGDPTNLRQDNLTFTVQLSNPKNCNLIGTFATGTIICEDGTYLPTDNMGYSTPNNYAGYTLVWSDEFSDASLNNSNWNQEIGNNNGWGNNELEYYTKSLKNTFLSNGNLIIEARREVTGSFNYTSGRMTTQGKRVFKYGRIDIRAKLPVDKGLWPALWMLGSNINDVGWPSCGEIDIMELVGDYPNRTTGTLHWGSSSNAHIYKGADYYLTTGDFSEEFHVFSIVWQEDNIKWYVDDNLFYTKTTNDLGVEINPFSLDQFFIFNVAVGGNWPGSPDGTTQFPQRMFVDYVRVFQ